MIVVSPILRTIGRILSYLLYLVTLVAAYGGTFSPHIFTVPAALTLVFPYLALASFLVAVFWFIARRWISGGLGILILFACWTPLTMAFPLKFSSKPTPGRKTFSIVSYNILHFEDMRSKDSSGNRSAEWLLDTDADIVCLVEYFGFNLQQEPLPGAEYTAKLKERYPYVVSAGGSHDMTVLSKYPVEPITLPSLNATLPLCYSFWRVKIDGQPLTIAVVHLPSFSLSDEERKVITDMGRSPMKNTVNEFKGPIRGKLSHAFSVRAIATTELVSALSNIKGPVIVCGDFNDVPASWTYRHFLDNGFHDAFAETNFGPMHTYNAHLMYFHLDQIMYRGALKALDLHRGKIDSSDHYPLVAQFEFTE